MSRSKPDGSAFRPLTIGEQLALSVLLEGEFPGNTELRKQAQGALAQSIDSEKSLALIPSRDAPPAEVVRRIPIEAELEDEDGVTIHVLLHVVDGYLNELEVYRDDSGPLQRSLSPSEFRLIIL